MMADMTQYLPSYIRSMTRYMSGAKPIPRCLQALACWATNLTLRGKHIVLADFDATMMADCIDEANLNYEDGKKDPDIKKTDKFSHSKWVAWEEMVYTYFTATKKSR